MHIRIIAVFFLMSFCAIVVCAPAAAPGEAENAVNARKHLETGRDLFYRGVRAEYREMVAQAQKEFSAAVKIDPKCVDAHRGLQNCRKYFGENDRNVKDYKALLDAAPNNPEYTYLYTRLLDSLQRRYDMLAAALSANKDSYWLHYGLAIAKYKAGKDQSSVNSLEECIRIDSSRDEPYQLLINLYLVRGKDVDAVLGVCERAIEKADSPAFAHATAASILQTKGKDKEALEHFEKAVKLEPNNITYRVQIARMLLAAGNKGKAAEHLRTAITLGVWREGIEEAANLAGEVFGIKWPISGDQRGDLRIAEQYIREGSYENALSCVGDLLHQNKK